MIWLLLAAGAVALAGSGPPPRRKHQTFASGSPPVRELDTSEAMEMQHWVLLTTWRGDPDPTQYSRHVATAPGPGPLVVHVVASVPQIPDEIKIGKRRYHVCDGPGGVQPIVDKAVALADKALQEGVQAAAPEWSALAKFAGSILKAIPDAYERWRARKWGEWRQGLPDVKAFADMRWSVAQKAAAVAQVWRYEIDWDGSAVSMPLVGQSQTDEIEIPWEDGGRDVAGVLSGEPPDVDVDASGKVRVTIHRPDNGKTPPGTCEARYDVTVVR